jgi:hypothetical protein
MHGEGKILLSDSVVKWNLTVCVEQAVEPPEMMNVVGDIEDVFLQSKEPDVKPELRPDSTPKMGLENLSFAAIFNHFEKKSPKLLSGKKRKRITKKSVGGKDNKKQTTIQFLKCTQKRKSTSDDLEQNLVIDHVTHGNSEIIVNTTLGMPGSGGGEGGLVRRLRRKFEP